MRVADTNEKRLPMTHPAGPDSVPGARVCQKQRRTKGRQRTWTKYRVPMTGIARMWKKMNCQ